MRISTISSSFATAVITVATVSVTLAGIAVRTFLHLTNMRESMGYWLELCQSEFARGWEQPGFHRWGNAKPGHKPGLFPLYGIAQLAVCPAPSRLADVRVNRHG